MNEPSVLDYVKALLTPWKGKPPAIPPLEGVTDQFGEMVEPVRQPLAAGEVEQEQAKAVARVRVSFPWRTATGLLAGLFAQMNLAYSRSQATTAVTLYIVAAVFFVLAAIEREWMVSELDEDSVEKIPLSIRQVPALIAIPLVVLAFISFGDRATASNHFNTLNIVLWLAASVVLIVGLYQPYRTVPGFFSRAADFFRQRAWNIKIPRFTLAILAAAGLVIFFRLFRLNQVPGEMFSDHAEKLLDVMDVLAGKTSVFFVRNTGREGFQFYLTALVAAVFGTKITFLSLKIGTVLAGLLSLPYIYLLGKEVGGRTVGLLAFTLAGIAYWPNVISRVGLRFPLLPLFAAPAIYYLIHGLRYRRRNDFIWSGIALGIGLHGYSPMRWIPVVLVVILVIYLLHRHSRGNRTEAVWGVLSLAAIALVLFLPLLRYAIENPDMFSFRMLTRMGTTEQAYSGPVLAIFLTNLWKSLVMFFYNNGNVWVNSIPGRPALDVVTAVMYFAGSISLFIRYLRQRHWLDLTMILLVPLLLMTSVLSLAFPDENPSLNRGGAAIIPVFIIAAFGFVTIIQAFFSRVTGASGRFWVGVLAVGLLTVSIVSNYRLVFDQYSQQYDRNAWNTSQIGQVISDFAGSQGTLDTAYVIPYPYWVDTRLVGMQAGYPGKDYALQRDQIENTLGETRAKLFIYNISDADTANLLESLYPTGALYRYSSGQEVKDFMLFFVPPIQP